MASNPQGEVAEEQACRFLQNHGLTLVERNYRCRLGEIDLIMAEGETLVFIEVKFRHSSRFGHAREWVTATKQRRIITTANHYLLGVRPQPNCRFDVVALSPVTEPEWIKSAFDAF
ncbi:MAG: YraN family protein [Gammaproteobacteria bacterium]|nr:YraN family protein [Gammaproteobacteria bacterium]